MADISKYPPPPAADISKYPPPPTAKQVDISKYPAPPSELNISDTIEVDPNIVFGGDQPITEPELDLYSKKYGVSKEDLRDYVGWRGGIAPFGPDEGIGESLKEMGKQAIGVTSEALGFGAAGFIAKKLNDDPQFRLAADDLTRLIERKRSYLSDVTNLTAGAGAAMGLGKAAASASKLPAMAKSLYEPVSAVSGAATHGLFHSGDGQELQNSLTSGMYGMIGYGGFRALGAGAAKLQKMRKGKLPPLSDETNDAFANARREFEEINQKGNYQDFRDSVKSPDGIDSLLESGDRSETFRFMEFINGKYRDINTNYLTEARKMIAPDDIKPEHLERVVSEYGESLRAGKVTDDVIDAFLIRDRAIDNLHRQNIEELQRLDIVEPDDLFEASFQQNVLERVRTGALSAGEDNLLRSTQVFRLIDDRAGTGLEPILNKAYRANAMKSGYERKLLDSVNKAKKLQHKGGFSSEEMYRNVQNPSITDPATEAWRDAFQKVRETSNDLGLEIRDLGRTYVPQRKKSGADLIKTLEKQADELGLTSDVAAGDISFKQLLRKRDELLEESPDLGESTRQWIEELDGKSRDMAYLVYELERATKEPIRNVFGIKRAVNSLRSESVINNMAEIQVGALHARDELAPPAWLVETNLNRLFRRSVSEAGNQIFMDPIARQFSLMSGLLRTFKENRASLYVDDFVSDMMGMARKGKMRDTSLDRVKKDLKILDSDSILPEMQEAVMDMSVKTFYASVMGARIDNVVRNLTQPLTKAVPEFGWTRGTKYLTKAYKDMARDIVTGGWKKMVRETEEVYNLKAPLVRAEDFAGIKEDIFRNMDNRKVRVANKVVDSYAQWSMRIYMASDEVNRVATTNMSKAFVNDLVNAKGTDLVKLKKITERWPKSLQRELDIAMSNPATTKQDLTQLIAGHLVPEAQVMYGTLGRSRIHRSMGQIISTLSDYPHHMLSDAYYRLVTNKVGGMVDLIRIYSPSALLFIAADRMIDSDDPLVRETMGKGGAMAWHPLNTISSASSIFGAPHIENVAKLGYTMINPKNANSREWASKNFFKSYGLFPGMAWKHGENGYDLLKAWNDPKEVRRGR